MQLCNAVGGFADDRIEGVLVSHIIFGPWKICNQMNRPGFSGGSIP
jgi:hypothetical protein